MHSSLHMDRPTYIRAWTVQRNRSHGDVETNLKLHHHERISHRGQEKCDQYTNIQVPQVRSCWT